MTKVAVSYLHPGHVQTEFHLCLLRMLAYDRAKPDQDRKLSAHLAIEANSGGLTDSRNAQVREFLDGTDNDWLWIVDSDMGFAPDTVDLLVQSADPVERPIVGGLCFAQYFVDHGADELGVPGAGIRYFPTIYRWNQEANWPETVGSYPPDAIFECAATGAACLLIHRSVLEKMRTEYSGPHHWFSRPIIDGREMGEDITFCLRARAVGFPIYVDSAVKTSHKKSYYLTEQTVNQLMTARSIPAVENRAERRRRMKVKR